MYLYKSPTPAPPPPIDKVKIIKIPGDRAQLCPTIFLSDVRSVILVSFISCPVIITEQLEKDLLVVFIFEINSCVAG